MPLGFCIRYMALQEEGDKRITVRLGDRKPSGEILKTNTDSLLRKEVVLKFWLRKMEV